MAMIKQYESQEIRSRHNSKETQVTLKKFSSRFQMNFFLIIKANWQIPQR